MNTNDDKSENTMNDIDTMDSAGQTHSMNHNDMQHENDASMHDDDQHVDSKKSISDIVGPAVTMVKRYPVQAIVGLVLILGLAATGIGLQQSQDVRNRAATPTGTATFTLVPASGTIFQGQRQIELYANTGTKQVDGFQLIADLTGTAVPSDVTIVPESINGTTVLANSVTTISGGVRLNFVLATQNPSSSPITTNGQNLKIATITFTAPASGTMNFVYNQTLSKITEYQTAVDILLTPQDQSYTFNTGDPNLTNTPTPTTSDTTPTPTPNGDASRPSCDNIVYYYNGSPVDPSTLSVGDTVQIALVAPLVDLARIRVNGSAWQETQTRNVNGELYIDYTITSSGAFAVEAEISVNGQWY